MKTALLSLVDFSSLGQTASVGREALRVLHRVNPALSWTGWANVALAALAIGLLLVDHRLVAGAPAWLKPLKFSLSITAFAWTLGWLLADLPGPAQRSVQLLSWGVALSMAVEQAVIFVQAARGTTSHYNASTPLNGLLFGLMGVFIVVNTLMSAWAVYLAWHYQPHGPAGYVWGLRLGLLLFLVGSLLGGMMIHNMQHTVGAPDGGPGLPGLGWSTRAGDLRVAHFLGMHALQVLPLLGWALSRAVPQQAAGLTWAGAVLYAGAVAGLFALALASRPLLWAGH
ncbi:hypothetical protein [Hymenobacter coccineus]|uniref:Uncharacterized protein n=1 Tax=Hymenobacter coccineus TaxID=1908235 RepID=A0A1G1SXG8_9BACT|nr:hypothetical protein [Hymenobacter coccineus]OGX83321.1 hypothetical protein BEN49_12570 [Hymenobacter coccineus]